MTEPDLKDLQSVLQSALGDDLTIQNYEMKDLLPPGENYGSKIVSLHVTITRRKIREDLDLVGKIPPPTREQREMLDSPNTFRKEIFMYSKIFPFYRKLEIESGIEDSDLAPRYFGSRLGPDPEDFEDALILIEDLRPRGYYTAGRRTGCDLQHARMTVKAMARFHALGMAAKEKDPEFFEILRMEARCIDMAHPEQWVPIIAERIQDVKKDPEIRDYFEACGRCLAKGNYDTWLATPEEPWSSIIHADFWANNIMYKKSKDGQVDDVKLIDFQNYLFLSPLRDLTFFVTCGLDHEAIDHVDELIDFYYESLLERLKLLNCDVRRYDRESFEERLREDAQVEFSHCLSMTKIITLDVEPSHPDCQNVKHLLQHGESNPAYTRKLRDLVMTYNKRGWLQEK